MKYVGIITTDNRARWSQWHSGSTSTTYRSDHFDTRDEAVSWINNQLNIINAYIEKNKLEDCVIDSLVAQFDEKDLIPDKYGNAKIDHIFNSYLRHIKEFNEDILNRL